MILAQHRHPPAEANAEARRPTELLDGLIDLVGDQEVETQNVVGRLPRAPAVEPFAVAQLVPFPRLADGESGEQREQCGEQWRVSVHARSASGTNDCTMASQRPWARRISSRNSRAAPAPPGDGA